jgi:uncharacterized protein (TIGR00290 family)
MSNILADAKVGVAIRPKVLLSWSSGKDSAWALHVLRQEARVEVVGLLTTLTEDYRRVAMHAVREGILEAQAAAVGLHLHEIYLPSPCSNDDYAALMADALARYAGTGLAAVAFGDLFLEDVRAYRETQLAQVGLAALFPLWGRDTAALAREMIAGGLRAIVTCVDPRQLDPAFVGRTFDDRFLADLPPNVDPCGERGEFHTCVTAGPMLAGPIPVVPGEVVERDGFVFADLEIG